MTVKEKFERDHPDCSCLKLKIITSNTCPRSYGYDFEWVDCGDASCKSCWDKEYRPGILEILFQENK